MTLIVTAVTELGLVQASDSNLSPKGGGPASVGQKVFPLRFAPAALALAGSYNIAGQTMGTWMPDAISDFSMTPTPTLESFAHYLEGRLNAEATLGVTGLLLHIVGYETDADGSHPEFWFVRNFDHIDGTTGNYEGLSDTFTVSEDFWTHDYRDALAAGHRPGGPYRQTYFNGFPSGRISYHALSRTLQSLLQEIWVKPEWSFRPPESIEELASFIGLEIDLVGALFASSDYPSPYIGGPAQTEVIPAPPDAVPL